MDARAIWAYKVESEIDPKRYYQVTIDRDKTPATRCNCDDYVLRNKVCSHIERALTCHLYGL
jgi:hypothetical protein